MYDIKIKPQKLYLSNALSLNMISLDEKQDTLLLIKNVNDDDARLMLKHHYIISIIGHDATAKFISQLTGVSIPVNRAEVKLKKGEAVLVFQLLQRLPEGKILTEEEITKIPHKWFLVGVF
jgi:hypothetical protein